MRQTTPAELQCSLTGDFENVILKSMRKVHAMRYASAEVLFTKLLSRVGAPFCAKRQRRHSEAGGIDSDHSISSAFRNEDWPADYFIDRRGRIRYHHFGEGEYEKSEASSMRFRGKTEPWAWMRTL